MSARLTCAKDAQSREMALSIAGTVDLSNVADLLAEGEKAVQSADAASPLRIDVSLVENAQSVLISLLLRLVAAAEAKGLNVSVSGLSGKMFDIARVSGVETVLPLADESV
ncbi:MULTISPECIES: STAS domain-containing protein [unclassified Hahella]|uniref:STAS domain-containing protein n=1 Tax=unclassified Hahella TaxID=2624107 RepID=UPI001C1EEED7|nr:MULTISPECIES: STAS domain-containing protein [unclassified Hahella]MBU6949985.1 STAS domain-containing protein [Hahella sp. HN01]MDG9668222.1 STAS domain-containing protein [Hahella sp. CR1]